MTIYKELRKTAKKKVETKKAFYMLTIIFSFVAVVLIMLSTAMPSIGFWLVLPIPILLMILGIVYLFAFGLPWTGELSDDWEKEEIEKEMVKLYRRKRNKLPVLDELSDTDVLELKELERMKRKWDGEEDYV